MKTMEKHILGKIVGEIAAKHHIVDPLIKFQYSNKKGEGYLGKVMNIKLVGKNKDLNVIVKSAVSNETVRAQVPIRELHQSEVYFYDHIVPGFIKFQQDHGLENHFMNVPKCYATQLDELKETLVLEDLKDSGFVCCDRQKLMNHQHLKFVFKEFARFHAISLAMQNLEPEKYHELTSGMLHVLGIFCTKAGMDKGVEDEAQSLKTIFDSKTEEELHKSYSSFADEAKQQFTDCVFKHDQDIHVILHGDCWSNNMMFKYEDSRINDEPSAMKFIDFQLVKQGSPVIDLSHFFYASATDGSLNNLDEYLSIYHESLKDTLANFDLGVEKIYSFERMKSDWKKYGRFGLMMGYYLIRQALSDTDEVPDMEEIAESGIHVTEGFNYKSRRDDEYRRRIKVLFTHLHENQFF